MTLPRSFPIEAHASDPRFSLNLIADVAEVLGRHGYLPFAEYTPLDVTELHLAVFAFSTTEVSADGACERTEHGVCRSRARGGVDE